MAYLEGTSLIDLPVRSERLVSIDRCYYMLVDSVDEMVTDDRSTADYQSVLGGAGAAYLGVKPFSLACFGSQMAKGQ